MMATDRDLKPENLLLSDHDSMQVKISNFDTSISKQNSINQEAGTPIYTVKRTSYPYLLHCFHIFYIHSFHFSFIAP